MEKRSKISISLLFLSFSLPASLAHQNLTTSPYWSVNTHLLLQDGYNVGHFTLGNVPFYKIIMVILSKILFGSLSEIINLPLAGILISIGVFLFTTELFESWTFAGPLSLLSTLTITRGPWGYSVKRLDLFVLLILMIVVLRMIEDWDVRIALSASSIFLGLNMIYHTGGGWGIVLFFVPLLLIYTNSTNKSVMNRQWGLALVWLLSVCIFLYFTQAIYAGGGIIFGSFTETLQKITTTFSILNQTPPSLSHSYFYAGKKIQSSTVNRILLSLKIAFLVLCSIPVGLLFLENVIQAYRRKLSPRQVLFLSAIALIVSETIVYVLAGAFITRLYFLLFPFFALYYILTHLSTPTFPVAAAFLLVLCLLSSGIFYLTITNGGLNHVERHDVDPAANWVSNYNHQLPVRSDLYTLTYVPLERDIKIQRYNLERYQELVGDEEITKPVIILLNEDDIDMPIYGSKGNWTSFQPLNKKHEEIQSNEELHKVYSSGSMSVLAHTEP